MHVQSQPSCHVIHVYINVQMVIIMLNEIFLGLLMMITEYLMILLKLMILIVVNSLHRDNIELYREYMEMDGDELVILSCTVM